MNRTIAVTIAAALSTFSIGAGSAELSDSDRAELRQRAQEFNNQRSRDPGFQPGQGRAQRDDEAKKPATRAGKSKRAETARR